MRTSKPAHINHRPDALVKRSLAIPPPISRCGSCPAWSCSPALPPQIWPW